MKKFTLCILLVLLLGTCFGQRFITKTGQISFTSDTPFEKIEASNNQVNCALDFATGEIIFKILIRSFEFDKALMQEHFNENYLLSYKFPNATFRGEISNLKELKLNSPNKQDVLIDGIIKIKGVEKSLQTKAQLKITDEGILAQATLTLEPQDFNIKIPKAVFEKIAKVVIIQIEVYLKPID